MSTGTPAADEEAKKRRYREFMELLPLATVIAGMPLNGGPRSYTTDQMEARAQVLVQAFKVAKQTVRNVVKGD